MNEPTTDDFTSIFTAGDVWELVESLLEEGRLSKLQIVEMLRDVIDGNNWAARENIHKDELVGIYDEHIRQCQDAITKLAA